MYQIRNIDPEPNSKMAMRLNSELDTSE